MKYISKAQGIKAWHFLEESGCTANGEGIKVEAGQTLKVEPPIELCSHGYHASVRAIDALDYAPGPIVSRVLLHGQVIHDNDKAVATHRTCLWIADATRTLHEFAIWVAEQALEGERKRGCEPHVDSWKALQVKRLWLEGKATDQELAAARDAAWAAARGAAWDAAWDAARAAARAAARGAAWDAARDAARGAARDAARDAYNDQLEYMLSKLEFTAAPVVIAEVEA